MKSPHWSILQSHLPSFSVHLWYSYSKPLGLCVAARTMGNLLDRIFVIVIYVLTGNVAPHLYMYMHAKWMEFGLNLFVPKNIVQYVTEKFPYRAIN